MNPTAADVVTCAHCGLPVLDPKAADSVRFCCIGCSVAWSLCSDLESDTAEGAGGSTSDRWLGRLMVGAFLTMGVMVFSLAGYGESLEGGNLAERASRGADALAGLQRLLTLALCVPVVHLLGLPLLHGAWLQRRFLSADTLVLLSVGAAFGVSAWNTLVTTGPVWFETVAMVLTLTSTGKWLDARAKGRARGALAPLLVDSQGTANVLRGNREEEVPAAELQVGDVVRVRPGAIPAADGQVLRGCSFVDSSTLTGESEPRSVGPGARLLAGTTVLDGTLDVRVEAACGERVRDAVEHLLAEATLSRSRQVRMADAVAGFLLPGVLLLAVLTFLVQASAGDLESAWQRSLAVLLIACPCALGIATPLAFWSALGHAWRSGVLVKGSDVLERLARTRRVLFDKTGTLTQRDLELADVTALPAAQERNLDRADLLRLAAGLEAGSEHPIGAAIRRAFALTRSGEPPTCTGFEALPGVGVRGMVEGRHLRMVRAPEGNRTCVALDEVTERLGTFRLNSRLLPGTRQAIDRLKERDLAPTILTGDSHGPAAALAATLGVPVESELLPKDKLEHVRSAGPKGVVFVGDGINDVGALRMADVGIVVGGATAQALEAGDVTLLRAPMTALPELLELSKRAVHVARGNLAWAFSYNAVGLYLASTGTLTPVLAALAMVLSSAAVVLNSSSLGKVPSTLAGESLAAVPQSPPPAPLPSTGATAQLGA